MPTEDQIQYMVFSSTIPELEDDSGAGKIFLENAIFAQKCKFLLINAIFSRKCNILGSPEPELIDDREVVRYDDDLWTNEQRYIFLENANFAQKRKFFSEMQIFSPNAHFSPSHKMVPGAELPNMAPTPKGLSPTPEM